MLLMEQSICNAAHKIAQTFASQYPLEAEEWSQAAKELRFPFWDWTHPITAKEGLPPILYQKQLELQMPGGKVVSQENILAFYRFRAIPKEFTNREESRSIRELEPKLMAYFKNWTWTYRWPNSDANHPHEDIPRLNQDEISTFKGTEKDGGSWAQLTNLISHLFTFRSDLPEELWPIAWDEFSNRSFQSKPAKWEIHGSLEQPHDQIHLAVGGTGHMCDPDTAGFDPIFFLHHCNVDRILAFWEHIYPDYVAGENGYPAPDGTRSKFTQPDGTFVQRGDPEVTDSTNLAPFRKDKDSYWNPHDTHSMNEKFGKEKHYTYPSIEDVVLGEKVTPEQRERQRATLQNHFALKIVSIRNSALRLEQAIFKDIAETSLPKGLEPVYNYRHFVISVSHNEFAVSGSHYVKVFCRTRGREAVVGSFAIFARRADTRCGGCQGRRAAGRRIHGVIPVPHSIIVDIVESNNLNNEHTDTDHLIETIKKSLCVRIILPNGQVHSHTVDEHPGSEELLLSANVAPVLELHSANVGAQQDDSVLHDSEGPQEVLPKTPYEFYDWKKHGSFAAGHWVKV